ncbi:hypothetical protein TNCV_5134701 [Trichonephila clavipes]|nr:hypothetical protein TNCV_5134701 [Trichonephila clavipes]
MPLSRMENTTFAMPSIIDSHDMGLRTVYSPDAQKKTPIQRLCCLTFSSPVRRTGKVNGPLVKPNSLVVQLAVPNDPRYARLVTNLRIEKAR